jgi:hypothetical protein
MVSMLVVVACTQQLLSRRPFVALNIHSSEIIKIITKIVTDYQLEEFIKSSDTIQGRIHCWQHTAFATVH